MIQQNIQNINSNIEFNQKNNKKKLKNLDEIIAFGLKTYRKHIKKYINIDLPDGFGFIQNYRFVNDNICILGEDDKQINELAQIVINKVIFNKKELKIIDSKEFCESISKEESAHNINYIVKLNIRTTDEFQASKIINSCSNKMIMQMSGVMIDCPLQGTIKSNKKSDTYLNILFHNSQDQEGDKLLLASLQKHECLLMYRNRWKRCNYTNFTKKCADFRIDIIGKHLRQARESINKTLLELEQESKINNINFQYITNIEQGSEQIIDLQNITSYLYLLETYGLKISLGDIMNTKK